MEKALALSAPEFRKIPASGLKGCGLLYLGDEFCQNLMPSPEDFERALKTFNGRVVLVTPLLTDEIFDEVERIIKKLASPKSKLEIVANDLGLLYTIRKKYAARVNVTLGRILGHRVKMMPEGFAGRFLKEHGVSRVEIDDASLVRRFAPFKGVKLSFHSPFRYISVTRFCPWEKHWPAPCGYACLGKIIKLKHRALPQPLFLKGASYRVKTSRAPKHPMIDRLVKEPVLLRSRK